MLEQTSWPGGGGGGGTETHGQHWGLLGLRVLNSGLPVLKAGAVLGQTGCLVTLKFRPDFLEPSCLAVE